MKIIGATSEKQTADNRIAAPGTPIQSNSSSSLSAETMLVEERYQRRQFQQKDTLYSPLDPAVYMTVRELDRAIVRWITTCRIAPVRDKRVIEIGCGHGWNLLRLITLGFR